jgi:LmbE family N-acetylglucosaminyl deacetylase
MDSVRTLVITAHPDDVDFGAAGTVALWSDAGETVTYCVVTDGDSGGFDPAVARSDIGGIRRGEQEAAARQVGVADVRFLGYPDGGVTPSLALRRDLSRVIRKIRPHRVLTHSPERNWINIHASHPDHLAVGEAAACAVYPDARNPFAYPELLADEGLEAHIVHELWLLGGPSANRYVDITDVLERKLAAIMSHRSQLPDADAMTARVEQRLRDNAARGNLAQGRLAEAFQVVIID